MKYQNCALLLVVLAFVSGCAMTKAPTPSVAPYEIVAELNVTPGNVAVSQDGRIFATIHPFRRNNASQPNAQLIEITSATTWEAFPDKSWNGIPGKTKNTLNSPLGLVVDHRDWLWVIDSGNFLKKPASAKIVAFDIASGLVKFRYDFPQAIAPQGSFLQDLAISPDGKFVYIADAGAQHKPGLIVLNVAKKKAFRYEGLPQFEAENVDVKVRGQVLTIAGKNGKQEPARFGINPITVSADGATVFFGAMSGTSWYSIPSESLQRAVPRAKLAKAIQKVGPKPISDGAVTGKDGTHYFTAINDDAIVALGKDGKLVTVLQDPVFEWPDSVRFGPDGSLYVCVNQLNRTAALNGTEGGTPPYRVVRIKTTTSEARSTEG